MQKTKKQKAPKPIVSETSTVESATIEDKVEKMTQIDGKDYGLQTRIEVSKKKSLDEIWGRKFSKFKTSDQNEYQGRLARMTKMDLQQECIKIGLMPHDNRDTMVERLVKEFRKFVAAASTSSMQPTVIRMSEAGHHILSRHGNKLV